jgi:tryptophanase
VPRRVYTCCHLEYVAEALRDLHAEPGRLRPMEILEQPAALRHFQARLRPRAACPEPALA